MHKLTLGLLTASLCFLAGVIAAHTSLPRRVPPPKPEVIDVPDSTPVRGAAVRPGRGERAELDGMILDRIARSVDGKRRGVRFAPAFCTCPGIIPDQKSYLFGFLKKGDGFVAEAYIAEAASAQAAAGAMTGRHPLGEGWQAYALGDEAYLRKSPDGRSGTIKLRIRNVVVQVSGEQWGAEVLAEGVAEAVGAS